MKKPVLWNSGKAGYFSLTIILSRNYVLVFYLLYLCKCMDTGMDDRSW